jgi:hypothetical protein
MSKKYQLQERDGRQVIYMNCESGKKWGIPTDPDNTDYQEYLKWLAEGNEPLPADEEK